MTPRPDRHTGDFVASRTLQVLPWGGLPWSDWCSPGGAGRTGGAEEDGVTYYGSGARGRSSGRKIAVAVLVIIGILAIIAGIVYLTEPAKSLPSILGTITHPASRADAHRTSRGWGALAVGVVLLVAAWFASRMGGSSRR